MYGDCGILEWDVEVRGVKIKREKEEGDMFDLCG